MDYGHKLSCPSIKAKNIEIDTAVFALLLDSCGILDRKTLIVVYRPIGWRTCLQSRDRKFDWDPGIKTLIPRRRCRSRAL